MLEIISLTNSNGVKKNRGVNRSEPCNLDVSLVQVKSVALFYESSSFFEGVHSVGLGRCGPGSLHIDSHVLGQFVNVGLAGLQNVKIISLDLNVDGRIGGNHGPRGVQVVRLERAPGDTWAGQPQSAGPLGGQAA